MSDRARLQDVATIAAGRTPRSDSTNRTGSGVPLLLRPSDFGRLHPAVQEWTTAPTTTCAPGDILLALRGPAVGRINVADRPYCLGRGIAEIRPHEPEDSRFLRYALAAEAESLRGHATASSSMPSLREKELAGITLSWPEAETRHAAAAALATLDEKQRRSLETADLLNRMAGVVFRRAAYGGDSSDASLNGAREPQRGWRTAELETLLESASSGRVDPQLAPDEVFEFYGLVAYDADRLPEIVKGADIKGPKLVVAEPSVLVARLEPQRQRVWWPRSLSIGSPIASTEFTVLRPAEGVPLSILYAAMRFDPGVGEYLAAHASGATRMRVSNSDLLRTPLPLPEDRGVQDELAKQLSTLAALEHERRVEARTIGELRDALLRPLVGGEKSVAGWQPSVELEDAA